MLSMSPFWRNRRPEPLERVLFRFLRRQPMHIRRALTLAARAGRCELRVVARRGEAGLIPVVPPLRTDMRTQFAVQQDGFRELAPRSAEVNCAVRDALALKAAFQNNSGNCKGKKMRRISSPTNPNSSDW